MGDSPGNAGEKVGGDKHLWKGTWLTENKYAYSIKSVSVTAESM